MSKFAFRKSFIKVLKSIQKTQEIAEDSESVDALVDRLNNEPTNHLKAFTQYLEEDCGLSPEVISTLAEALLTHPEISKALGIKITHLWLQFKVYEALKIYSSSKGSKENKEKRRKAGEIFRGYSFSGSDLISLLKTCCTAIGQGTEDIQDMAGMITEGRGSELEKVFYKQPKPKPEPKPELESEPEQVSYNPDKGIEEQLRDLVSDFKQLPEGSLEKDLQREIILAHVQKNKTGRSVVDREMAQSKQSDIEGLKNKYMQESLSIPAEIEELFKKAATEEAYEALCALKAKMFSINVLELERLIQKTNEARKMIENKDVLFMIGNTGSGKSTNILRFLGYTLQPGKYGKLTTLVPIEELHKDHKTFYTSPEAKSCTRYINAVPIPDKMYKRGVPESKKTLVICDSPGFGDSAGVQVDIANGVGMINALHGARSVLVVVILPYDSLTGDRLAGAVKMSEIISNLFHELVDVLDSIAIYFNKVPNAEMIKQVPNLIESKLKYLPAIEKANEKLITFLREILERSRDEDNFIDPLKSDYMALFNSLYRKQRITDVRSFQYEFTDSTKREIEKFAQGERAKVRELFTAKKYQMAQFHLRMIEKLMNILHNNDKVRGFYEELRKFVEKESEKELASFEEIVTEIMNCKESQTLKAKLEDSKAKVNELESLFKDFDSLHVVSASKIDEIIQDRKGKLLEQFKDLSKVTAETIVAVKSFSELIDSDLGGKVLKKVECSFNEVYAEADQQAKSRSYSAMGENLKYLTNLAGFNAQLSQKSAINHIANRLRDLKTTLSNEVEGCFTSIAESITKGDARLSENAVREGNLKIKRIKEIEALNFLDNSREIRSRLAGELGSIELRCKRIIRDLENMRLTLNEDVEGKTNIDKDELNSKKRQIELLMKVENLEESVADDYAYAKASIALKLRENVDILKNCIAALKSDKNDEIYKNLDNIKKATLVVLQCSQIVGQTEGLEIAESISNEFVQYLGGVLVGLQQIEFKLSQINEDTLRRIKEQHSKIESYGKMSSIGKQVQAKVQLLKHELNEKLKVPFFEFLSKEVPYLQEKKHYRFIPYSVDKLERFSAFALGIEDIVSSVEYAQISECEADIKKGIEPFYKDMEGDIEDFLQLDFAHGKFPPYLKDLVKTLLTISQKSRACDYLTHKLNFEVKEKLNNIQNKLEELKDKMQNSFDESQTNAEELQALLADCKLFGEIEDVYKSKGELESKFGFRDLQRKCNEEFSKSLKTDEDRCKQIIEGNKPTKISFQELQIYYDKFIAIKSKRSIITTELRRVEQKTLKDLKDFRHEMDNLNFINNSSKIEDFLEALNQAVQLERNLKKLYSLDEDRNQIEIKQVQIQKIALKIINVFESEFEVVMELLKNYNVANINQELKTFGQLETMIYEVFRLDSEQLDEKQEEKEEKKEDSDSDSDSDSEEQAKKRYGKGSKKSLSTEKKVDTPGGHQQGEVRLASFIKDSVATLRALIESHNFIKEAKITAKSTQRLKNLLEILKRGVQLQIKTKYEIEGPNFTVDEKFQTFYSYSNEEKRKELRHNVERYLEGLTEDYKENYNSSTEIANSIKKNIDDKIRLLPTELRVQQAKAIEEIRKTLVKENDELITKSSSNILSNPANIANFFALASRAKANGQVDLHGKWVKSFVEVYSAQEQKANELSLETEIAFMEASLIEVLARHKDYFTADSLMFAEFRKKYDFWLSHLTRRGQNTIKVLHEMLSVTGGNEQKKTNNHKLLVEDIFKVYFFVAKIKDDSVIDHTDFRQKFFESYERKLSDVVDCYKETLKGRPDEKLDSKEILDPAKMRKLQSYVENLTLAGAVIEEIDIQLHSNQKSQIFQPNNFLSSLTAVDPHLPVLQAYQDQIAEMLRFINHFDFCSDIKRNFAPKMMEDDLNQLDRFYDILQMRQDFFKKHIIKQPKNQYDFTTLANGLLKKFDEYTQEAVIEINDTFKSVNGDPVTKINLLIKQLSLMQGKDRDLKFVPTEKVRQSAQRITKLLKLKFDIARDECNRTLDVAKAEFAKVSREIQGLDSKKHNELTQERSKYKTLIDKQVGQLKAKYEAKISLETEEAKKQEHRKALATEENSLKNDIQNKRDNTIKNIQDQFDSKVKDFNEALSKPVFAFSISIAIFQKALLDIFVEADKYKKYLETVLEGLAKMSPKFIKLVECCLLTNPNDYRSIGQVVLTSNKIFANFSVTTINKLIKGQDIAYVIKNLQRITLTGRDTVPDTEIRSIENMYKLFKQKYDELKDKYKTTPTQTTIKYMITPLKDLGNQIKTEFYQTKNPLKQARNKVELLAGIFALWAIIKAETFEGEVEFTIEPHPTQITTLILLLGISHPDEKLTNRLAQVGTGEGKSIVLAGLSSYLALVGFRVRCACYSAYLSGRDQQSFKILFERLGVENSIKYGTFNQLCEDILNGSGANLKEEVEKMILQPPQGPLEKFFNVFGFNTTSLNRGPNEIIHNPTILVIDEVDVFFDDNFFGNSYCPAITLSGTEVSKFLQHVWREVQTQGKEADPSKLIKSQEFKKLVTRYSSLQDLLKNQVHGMVAGALNYKHDYFIIEKRIAYKDNDSISYKINYGYKTVFAYLYEFQNNRVALAYLEKALQISLMVAEFSYAALPNYFCRILGVTGTLQVLPQYKKLQLTNRYRINDQYAIPSAFGINTKRTEEYHITETVSYNKKIVEMINKVQDKRPIIVFFKGPRELNEFFSSQEYQPFLKRTYNLTEEHDPSVRDSRIFNAVEPDKITLMSSAFGRGTDFVVRNDEIKEKGGLHIIHAFLSLEESEEVQIKGRTARQNGKGSYDCILDDGWLEQLTLTLANIPKDATSADLHSVLLKAREERIEKQSQTTMKMLLEAERKHQNVVEIFSKQKLAQKDLINYVATLNQYPEIRKVTIKTVLGLDATGSMGDALKKTCEIIGTAFEQTYAVLGEKEVKATIEVKIMIYRNYNSPAEQIIEGTTFENTPVMLKKFLGRVGPSGGWGNEAIEVLFQYLNREEKIDQVILIGDAAPNLPQEVSSKRQSKGESYWTGKGFPATHFDRELEVFKIKQCPVHTFHLKQAGTAFARISTATGGRCSPFNIYSRTAAEELTQFVVENILILIEKNSGKGKLGLVEAYRKMFVK